MSEKERDSLVVLERVRRGEIKMAEAARRLGICYRQCLRRFRRYVEEGAAGLTDRLRGSSGNRSMPEALRGRIVRLYCERYEGFGPVLFAEKLEAEHEIRVDHETVRRLLVKERLWTVTRKRKKRQKRGGRGGYSSIVMPADFACNSIRARVSGFISASV